jgi:hypothetical protein
VSGASRARRLAIAVASASLAVVSLAVACAPVQGTPLSDAPRNAGCPAINRCDAYVVPGAKTASQCTEGRCEYPRPDYAFTIVVNVPTSSFYGPGRTFVLTSADVSAQPGVTPRNPNCIPPTCVQLPELVAAEGKYRVTEAAATAAGLTLPEGTSLPVRVSFFPLVEGTADEAAPLGIPADALLTSSRLIRNGKEQPLEASYIDAVSVGRYLRVAYPEAPYDAYFPPAFTQLSVSERFLDEFLLGAAKTPLDDDTGDSRRATISRAEGLDGWRVWLIDSLTARRISSLHTLAGTKAEVVLHTVGWRQTSSPALKDDIEVLVAPPDAWLAVPRLQSRIINGQGLEQLVVPPVPGPAAVKGVVAHGEGDALTGIPSKVVFTSTRLRLLDGTLQPLLRYATSVSTDDTGSFRTVLPPGLYDVSIEPSEGTGFAKSKDTFDTSEALAKTYRPPLRTLVTGRVLLADGRPLSEAEILALPTRRTTTASAPIDPRPARTRTDREGAFSFEADQGQYDLVVDPEAGTGFPRLVQARSFGAGTADLGEIQVAPPSRLSFKILDPSQVGNPIVRAVVRVFAEAPGRGPPAVEIGRAMTNESGEIEILLAQQPR